MGAGVEVAHGFVTITPKFATSIKAALMSQTGSAGQALNSSFKTMGIAAGNLLARGIESTVGNIGSIMTEAIQQSDAIKRFPLIMGNLGQNTELATQTIHDLRNEIIKTPTDFTKATQYMTRFVETTKDLEKSKKLLLALNNAIIAGGAATQVQEGAWEQFAQALSKGKPDRIEVRSMMMAMPAQMSMVAQKLGFLNAQELTAAMTGKKATVTMQQFADALIEVNESGVEGFASLSEQAKSSTIGIDMAFTILHNRIVASFAGLFENLDYNQTLGGISDMADSIAEIIEGLQPLLQETANGLMYLFRQITDNKDSIKGVMEDLSNYIVGKKDTIKNAFKNLSDFFSGAFGSAIWGIERVIDILGMFSDVISKISGKDISFAKAIGSIVGFSFALKKGLSVLNIFKSGILVLNPVTISLGNGIKALNKHIVELAKNKLKDLKLDNMFGKAGNASEKLKNAFKSIGKNSKSAADSVKKSANTIKDGGDKIKSAGTDVSGAGKGFSTLAGEALKIVAIGGAIALTAAGMKLLADGAAEIAQNGIGAGLALAEMAVGMGFLIVVMSKATKSITTSAPKLLAFGSALLLCAAGMRLLADSAVELGNAGTPAIAAFGVIIAGMAGLAALFSVLGDKLTKAAPGMLALGASMLMVSGAVNIIVDSLKDMKDVSIESLVAVGIFTGVIMGLLAVLGNVAAECPLVVLAILAIGAGMVAIGFGINLATTGIAEMNRSLADLVRAFKELCEQLDITAPKTEEQKNFFEQLGQTATQVVGAIGNLAEGISGAVAGVGDTIQAAGLMLIGEGLKNIASGMQQIEGASGGVTGAMESIREQCDGVGGAMENMRNTVATTFAEVIVAANNGKEGVVNAARDMINEVNNIFNNVGDSSYWAGVHIAESLARGLRDRVGMVKEAARDLVNEAKGSLETPAPGNSLFQLQPANEMFANNSIEDKAYGFGRSIAQRTRLATANAGYTNTTNVYINDNKYNDEPEIERCVTSIMRVVERKKGML